MQNFITITAGTGQTPAKLIEYAMCELQNGLYQAKLRGVQVTMPESVQLTVNIVAGTAAIGAYTESASQVNPEVTSTRTQANPEVTQTTSSTTGAQSSVTTPNGQRTVTTRSGGDESVTVRDYEPVG